MPDPLPEEPQMPSGPDREASADPFPEIVELPVTDILDLHSFAPRDIPELVQAYLSEAHALGFRALRIIHGRGIGAQREAVRKILAQTPFVTHYKDAPLEAGGWGATIVTLTGDVTPGKNVTGR